MDSIKEYLPEECQDYSVNIQKQLKNNGIQMDGLIIRGEEKVTPNIYLNPYYKQFKEGRDLSRIKEDIAAVYLESLRTSPLLAQQDFSYENMKKNLVVTVCNAEKNADLLENVPHELREDLALTYRARVLLPDSEMGTILIKNEHLERWGIDEQTLKDDAWKSMKQMTAPKFLSMQEIVKEMMPDAISFGESGEIENSLDMYVLTNAEKSHGAIYMFDKETMSAIAEKLGSNLVILPSSVHETIILKEKQEMDFERLTEIVRDVNASQVLPDEILSDNVYRFDKGKQMLTLASEPEQIQGINMSI